MNTMERYVAAYVVECLTGSAGENQDRVYEVLRSGAKSDDTFLNAVANLARLGPEREDVRELVTSLAVLTMVVKNDFVRSLLRGDDEESEAPKAVFVFEKFGRQYATAVLIDDEPRAEVLVSPENLPVAIERFAKLFPDGEVHCLDDEE